MNKGEEMKEIKDVKVVSNWASTHTKIHTNEY